LLKDNAGKLFLAGGFVRATIAGEKVSDIDLFGVSKDDLLRIAKDLTLERKGRFFSTDNAITVLSPPRFAVQFITRWLFAVPEQLVTSFDFTVCQAAIWAEQLDSTIENGESKKRYKFHSLISDAFYPDLAARRLVYTFPVRDEDVGGSLLRVIKFVKKGYNVQAPTLAGVIARVVSNLGFKSTDNEKWRAKVITGLLREVDPLTIVDGVDFVDEHETLNKETTDA
jgi:hypothetical protein